MIGVTITPSQIDYSKIITPETVEKLIVGDCLILTAQAKELVHVRSGQLKNSIMWKTEKKEGGFNTGGVEPAPTDAKLRDNPGEDTGYVGSNLEYAGPVEYGRKDMPNYPRNPYLRPAVDYTKGERMERYKGIVAMAIKQAYKPGTNNG